MVQSKLKVMWIVTQWELSNQPVKDNLAMLFRKVSKAQWTSGCLKELNRIPSNKLIVYVNQLP